MRIGRIFLKYAALMSLFMIAFSGMIILKKTLLCQGGFIFEFMTASICTIFGVLIGHKLLANKKVKLVDEMTILKYIAANALIIIIAAILLLINWDNAVYIKVIAIISGIFFYYFGLKLYNMEYYELYKETMAIGFAIIIISCIFLTNIFDLFQDYNNYCMVTFYFSLFIYLVVLNQRRIDSEIYVRMYADTAPKNIKLYNVKLISVMYVIIVAIINIKEIYQLIFLVLYNSGKFVLKIIMFVSSFLIETESNGGEGNRNLTQDTNNGSSMNIITIVFVILIILTILRFYKDIIRFIVSSIVLIKDIIVKIITTLFRLDNRKPLEIQADYVDNIEFIKEKGKISKTKIKKFKYKMKNIKKIKDNKDRVKAIYANIVYRLNIKLDIDLEKSNTTGEILEKASYRFEDKSLLKFITDVYERVKYGEKDLTDEEAEKAYENYELISSILDKK